MSGSDRAVRLPGVLGGEDDAGEWARWAEVDAYIAQQEDESGIAEAVVEWAHERGANGGAQ